MPFYLGSGQATTAKTTLWPTACAKRRCYLRRTLRIKYILFLQPAPPRYIDAEAHIRQIAHVVGIRIDDQFDAQCLGSFAMDPVDIQTLRMGIDLDKCAVLGR